MVDALRYMHGQGICHRDLKSENVIVNDHNIVKIIDLGFSIQFVPDVGLRIFCGTPHYMAPEIVLKCPYNGFKADIWALGVLLFRMLTAQFPFKGNSEKELNSRIISAQFISPTSINFEARHLLSKMLSVESKKRPNAVECLQS